MLCVNITMTNSEEIRANIDDDVFEIFCSTLEQNMDNDWIRFGDLIINIKNISTIKYEKEETQ